MADYSVTFARTARKELEKLPSSISRRIIERIEALIGNPRPSGSIKLQGNRNLWRIRIGDYRVKTVHAVCIESDPRAVFWLFVFSELQM